MSISQLQLIPSNRSDAHYAALTEIINLIYPDYPKTVSDWARSDATREKKYLYKRVLLWHTEQRRFVGFGSYGHTSWAHHPDRYFLDVTIRPGEWGKGYGKFLYHSLYSELTKRNPISIESESRENLERGIRFLTDRGYALKTTEYSSLLPLAEFDPDPFTNLVNKLTSEGFTFCNLKEYQQQEANFMQKLYKANCDIDDDIPWHETITHEPFERFAKRHAMNSDKRIDECYMLALFDDEIAGLTMLDRSPTDPTKLYTGMSGTMRPYRRRGLVSALKSISLGWAKTNLVTADSITPSVYTENEANNPMFVINERLGFIRQPSFLFYKKEFMGDSKQ